MDLHKATDHIDEVLPELMTEETDPVKKANLLVLHAMALNLSANTMALNALSVEIHDQKREFKDSRLVLKSHKSFISVMSVIITVVIVGSVWFIHNWK